MNIGVAGNFNQAFRLSSGEFFKWAAYDDLCDRDCLRRCVEILDSDPGLVLAYPRVVGIDEHGRVTAPHGPGPDLTSPDPVVRFSHIMQWPFWATSLFGVVRADVLALTGLMPSNAAGDHVLLAELSLHGRFHAIPEEGIFNRDHPGRTVAKSSIVTRAQRSIHGSARSAWLSASGRSDPIFRPSKGLRSTRQCGYAAIWLSAGG